MNGLLADCHPLSIYLDSVFGLSQNPDLATIGNRTFPLENPLSLIFTLGLHRFSQTIHPNVFCTEPPNITWNDILESPPPPQDTISVMYGRLFGTENTDLLSVFLPSGPCTSIVDESQRLSGAGPHHRQLGNKCALKCVNMTRSSWGNCHGAWRSPLASVRVFSHKDYEWQRHQKGHGGCNGYRNLKAFFMLSTYVTCPVLC